MSATFPAPAGIEVEVVAPLTSVCPFDGQQDHSVLTIRYRPAGRCVELGALHGILAEVVAAPVSHEALVAALADRLAGLLVCRVWVEDVFVRGTDKLTVRAERP